MQQARGSARRGSDWSAWSANNDTEVERLERELAEARDRERKARREAEETKERFGRLLEASRRFTNTLLDLKTQQHKSRRRIGAQHAIDSVVAEAGDFTGATADILKVLGENLGWQVAVFWIADEEGKALRCDEVWQRPDASQRGFEEACRETAIPRGEGLPGRAWAKNRSVWTRDLSQEKGSRREVGVAEGLRGALAFPINVGNQPVGVIELVGSEVLQPDRELLYTVDLIGRQLGQFAERRRAEEERERLVREIAAERALLASVLQQMPAGVFIAEPSGMFLLSNEEAEHIYGRPIRSVADCGRYASSYPDGGELLWEDYPLVRSLERGEVVSGMEHYVHRSDGTAVVVSASCAPVRDEEGRVVAAVKSFLDVTDLKQAERERERLRFFEVGARAEAAERERISRELHDRVAHSMGVVYQSLQLYEVLDKKAPERAEDKLRVAKEMARRSLEQTRNLSVELRRSETESGLVPALRDLLEVAVPDDICTKLSVSGEEALLADQQRGQVYLILREAIRNAVRHSGCARITVGLSATPEEFSGYVEDDGVGLDGNGFDGTGNGESRGGLGLRSIRERAVYLEGVIEIYSPPEGGTGVEVRVPLRNGRE